MTKEREICGVKVFVSGETYDEYKGTLEEQLEEKDKEIERLNNKLNAIRKHLKDNEQEYGSLEDSEKIVLGIIEGDDK